MMDKQEIFWEKEFPTRKPTRLRNFDYNTVGAYFITICTEDRQQILSRIVGAGVPDCPAAIRDNLVGAGVLDCPSDKRDNLVGAGVPDCPSAIHDNLVGAGVPDCPRVELTKHGQIAEKHILHLSDFYDYLSIESYVIMPNHIHLLLFVRANSNISKNGQSRTPAPTNIERANSVVSQFVSTFKRFCNKEYGENIWQSRFYEHVIRDRKDYETRIKYIHENPMRWYYDELYIKE